VRIAEVLTLSTGGIGRHVADLAPRLVGLGHAVEVYCPSATAAAHDLAGLEVAPLRRLHRARGVDLLHAHGYKAGALALPYARRWRVPLVVTWHNAVLGRGRQAVLGHLLQRLVARGADLTLGASSDLVTQARRCGARRAELAPVAAPRLGPPRVPRAEHRAALGLAQDELVVLTLGRLAPQKNLGMVLDVARALVEEPRVAFLLAGDGPLREELAARVRRDGSRVRLLGAVADVATLLAAADVALLTSTWEARALVAQEALQAGLPLVSTRVGGIEELVGDAAVLVEPGDDAAVVRVLRKALAAPDRLADLRAAGRRRAASWPDEEQVARSLAATFEALLRAPGAGRSTEGRPGT